jgi:uncharacterized protein (DUF1697 family)
MAELKACVEGLGLADVSTYIASGNVIFESDDKDATKLQATIERAIEKRFQLPVKVVVLDRTAYSRIVKAIPKAWLGDASLRANVAFVRRGTDAREVVRELRPDPAIEQVKAVNGAILWATKRNALNRSVMRKLIGGAEEVEVAYLLGRRYWGRGLATEAVGAILRLGFEGYGFRRIVAAVDPANVASIRVAEKAGMSYEREVTYGNYGEVSLYASEA